MLPFGSRLKRLRVSVGKTQAQVAAEISKKFPEHNMSQTGLSSLENRSTAPRESVLRILANYFNVPPSYFLESHQERDKDKDVQQMALDYVEAVKQGNVPLNSSISAHTSKHRRKDDETQDILVKLSMLEDDDSVE